MSNISLKFLQNVAVEKAFAKSIFFRSNSRNLKPR